MYTGSFEPLSKGGRFASAKYAGPLQEEHLHLSCARRTPTEPSTGTVEKKERFAGDFDRRSLRYGSAFAAEFAFTERSQHESKPEESPCQPHGKFLDFLGSTVTLCRMKWLHSGGATSGPLWNRQVEDSSPTKHSRGGGTGQCPGAQINRKENYMNSGRSA